MTFENNQYNPSGLTYSQVSPNIYDEYNKTGDGELFEQLVTDLILNKYSDCLETNEFILSLPKKDQRLAIMSLIDKETKGDANLLWAEMKAYVDSRIDKMDHVKDVIKIINKFVKDGAIEKKTHGEVMTPISLVLEMLDTLPTDVWSNPNLKWLDPCNGAGTFPFVVIYKLMNGLKEWESNVEKRYKHIVENMIYVCELQSRNVFLWMCGIDPHDEYTTNTYWGSFLDEGFDKHMKEVWGVDKFDIILGNPPYQEQKVGFKKSQPIWNIFVKKSISSLKEIGYLVLIHPSGWRSPMGNFRDIYELFKLKKIIYLSINDFKKGFETFGVGTNFDFYCIQNVEDNKNITKVKTSNDKIYELNLNKFSFIPNGCFDEYLKIIADENEDKVNILYSRSSYGTDKSNMSNVNNDQFIYPCVYTITKKDGIKLFFSNTKDNGHYNLPKVIWSNGLGTYPIIDLNGDYALTQFSYAIIDDIENLDKIKKALESKKFLELMDFAKFTNNKYDYKVISTFKKDFWKYFQ